MKENDIVLNQVFRAPNEVALLHPWEKALSAMLASFHLEQIPRSFADQPRRP